MRHLMVFGSVIGFVFVTTGCGGPVEAAVYPSNKPCTVQLKRDLLGLHSPTLMTSLQGGNNQSVSGTLETLGDDYVVVKQAKGAEVWIPRDVVLLIEVARTETETP
ncbi:MAG: hypothetical protein SGI88_20595 [Candidatus Hydrogenedentes bacterium]|nr:hypothetical protein [Candidatus Hydrogenedentota bacterium]